MFKTITVLALLVATTVQGKVNFEREFDDFPGFRYTPWDSLSSYMQGLANMAGYTIDTWDRMGTSDFEGMAWSDLESDTKGALKEMGFYESTWDCYVNHFSSYSWSELVQEDLAAAARVLGYKPPTWESGDSIAIDKKSWDDLTSSEQWAASSFCYFSDSWNGTPIPQMGNIPTLYPYFRYVMWDDLSNTQQGFALQAGWDEESWNVPDKAGFEYQPFAKLHEEQRQALLSMGFYEEQYDCYINHYYGYSWDELTQYGLAEYYLAFGWTESNYMLDDPVQPEAWDSPWDSLTDDQKEAADHLCWFKEIWEEMTIEDWHNDLQFPETRFTPWRDLSSRQQLIAADMGYTRATWDVPGTAEVEKTLFTEQNVETQDGLRALGFFSADQFDCYVNHYNGLDWDDLDEWGVLEYVKVLGWTEESWDKKKGPPASEDKDWDDLSETEKSAADGLCYFAELWDQSPLTVWEGVAWPEDRYWPWELLDSDEKELLASAGWNKATWNKPGAAEFEFTSWNALPSSTREALEDFGFYHNQWNCYMNHYDDYDWFELVLEDVAQYFEAFGWTEDTWKDRTEEPWAWTADWNELSEAQQDAAWEICYFQEIWDDMPLSEWPRSTRSGGPLKSVRRSESDDGGAGPALWIFLVLLVLAVGGGGYYYYKSRDQRENLDPSSFDPTRPTKEPPTETMDDTGSGSGSGSGSDEADEYMKEMYDVPVLS